MRKKALPDNKNTLETGIEWKTKFHNEWQKSVDNVSKRVSMLFPVGDTKIVKIKVSIPS